MKSGYFNGQLTALSLVPAVVALVLFSGCTRTQKKPTFEFMPHMMDSEAVKAQHVGPWGEGMRVPPEGTLSRNGITYAYATDPEGAGRALKNPLPRTIEVMKRGEKVYGTYCVVCHGSKGEGDGYIVPKFPRPPSLHSDKVRQWTDGRIFHVVTIGQNLMPSYASQISVEDRWAAIHYLRVLQRALHPTPADVQELEKARAVQ